MYLLHTGNVGEPNYIPPIATGRILAVTNDSYGFSHIAFSLNISREKVETVYLLAPRTSPMVMHVKTSRSGTNRRGISPTRGFYRKFCALGLTGEDNTHEKAIR